MRAVVAVTVTHVLLFVLHVCARGGVGGEGGEWMRELGLGFTNPVGTGGVLEWVGGLDQGLERWGGVMSV